MPSLCRSMYLVVNMCIELISQRILMNPSFKGLIKFCSIFFFLYSFAIVHLFNGFLNGPPSAFLLPMWVFIGFQILSVGTDYIGCIQG